VSSDKDPHSGINADFNELSLGARSPSTLDLGISDLILELERSLKGGISQLDLPFSERGRYYQNLVASGAFEQLTRAVDADLSEHGEDDILSRVYWIHSRLVLGTFPRGMLGLALNRVIRQITEILHRYNLAMVGSPAESEGINVDIKVSISAFPTLVPLVVASLEDSPELILSIREAWEDLQKTAAPLKAVDSSVDEDVDDTEPTRGILLLLSSFYLALIESGREYLNNPLVFSFCKGLFLVLSPLLIYSLWSQSQPGQGGSQVFNWVLGREPLVPNALLGSDDIAWLPQSMTQRWKDIEGQKAAPILPVLVRLEKLEGLKEISDSLEASMLLDPLTPISMAKVIKAAVTTNDALASQTEVVEVARTQIIPAALLPSPAVKNGLLETVDTSGPEEPFVVEPELEPDQTPAYGGGFPHERYFVTRGRTDIPQANIPQAAVPQTNRRKTVQRDQGDYYEIRVSTYIFEHPSLTSFRIAALEVGDEVLGQDIIGRWLKVVSYRGDVGFLPAKDARRAYPR